MKNRDDIMDDLEEIQDKVDEMQFMGTNEHNLWVREAIADFIEKLNEPQKPIRAKRELNL